MKRPRSFTGSYTAIVTPFRRGAEELYLGVMPQSWIDRYGDAGWLNRRGEGKGNLTAIEQAAQLVALAHAQRLTVSITLNAPAYTAAQLPEIVELVGQLAEIGVDGLIITDPGLMLTLRAAGSRLAVKASSVAALCVAGSPAPSGGASRDLKIL